MIGNGQMAAATTGLSETSPDDLIFISYFHFFQKAWECKKFSQSAIDVVLYPQILALMVSEVISLMQAKASHLQKGITPFQKTPCEELHDHRHELALNQYR